MEGIVSSHALHHIFPVTIGKALPGVVLIV
jgi:hypothetical protein